MDTAKENTSAGTGTRETLFSETVLLVLTDTCHNGGRQQRYDKYNMKEQCRKGKLAAHLSYNHVPSARKYSCLQSVNLLFFKKILL